MSILSFFRSSVAGKCTEAQSPGTGGKLSFPSDLNDDYPNQPSGKFPSSTFGNQERSFNTKWYCGRPWLEYSTERDAAFCYCCRKFCSSSSTGEYAFRMSGFRNWKTALEKKRGFHLHEISADHIRAMKAWNELKIRKEAHLEISTMLTETQLEKNRYYLSSILDVHKFLVLNELPYRGDSDTAIHDSLASSSELQSGLFMRLFEYTLRKDAKLFEIVKGIPKVATYTSHEVQNDVISLMAKMVQEQVVSITKSADIPYFTLKVDGTKDPTGKENISIVIRSVKEGAPNEHLLAIETTSDLGADALTEVILNCLQSQGLDPQQILSQCYDGAAVMAGRHGGVQVKLQKNVGKAIPYIHCYNHKLHLIVIHAISENDKVRQYFDICSALYNFTHNFTVSTLYHGTQLSRLLEQRWDGHLRTTNAILDNYEVLVELLRNCTQSNLPAKIVIDSTGLLSKVLDPEFRFVAKFIRSLLVTLKPANDILQSEAMDLLTASDVVDSVLKTIKKMRVDSDFEHLYEAEFGNEDLDSTSMSSQLPKKRKVNPPSTLNDSIVMVRIGTRLEIPRKSQMLCLYNGIIDRTVIEIETRFSAENVALLKSLRNLTSLDSDFLQSSMLAPLSLFCGVDTRAAKEEIATARSFLMKKYSERCFQANLNEMTKFLFSYREAFPAVYCLYASGVTFGASTGSCEASFSTLARILTPYRRGMLQERKANLVLLAHEKDLTNAIESENFLRRFNEQKSRRLRLW